MRPNSVKSLFQLAFISILLSVIVWLFHFGFDRTIPFSDPLVSEKQNLTLIRSSTTEQTTKIVNLKPKQLDKYDTSSKILVHTIAVGDAWYKALTKANRENYCKRHQYTLSFIERFTAVLEPGLHVNWHKITEALLVLRGNSTHEWVYFADQDLFIMNMTTRIESVIETAMADKYAHQGKDGRRRTYAEIASDLDIIIAKDGNGFNFGSLLVRKSPFTKRLFEAIWSKRFDKSIYHVELYGEQAIFSHMTKLWEKEMESRMEVVHQRVINAYGDSESGQHYAFQKGDFILHFPGGIKQHMRNYFGLLFELQPELLPVNEMRIRDCKASNKSEQCF